MSNLHFCFLMGERERGSHDSLAVNLPVLGKLEVTQHPRTRQNGAPGRGLLRNPDGDIALKTPKMSGTVIGIR